MEAKANTADKAGTSQYVNYLDIKLIGIDNLPKDWFEGNASVNGEAPSFANHPFRYEVRIDFPSNELLTHKVVKESNENLLQQHEQEEPEKYTKRESGKETSAPAGVLPENQQEEQEEHSSSSPSSLECKAVQSFTFTHGRLLQPLPEYIQYIHHATYTPSTTKTVGYNGNHANNNNNNVDNALKTTYTLDGMHTNNKNKSEKEEEDTDMYAELTSPFELPEELLKYTTEQDTHESTNCNNYNKDKKTQQETKDLVLSSSPSGIAAKHDTDDVDVVKSPQLM